MQPRPARAAAASDDMPRTSNFSHPARGGARRVRMLLALLAPLALAAASAACTASAHTGRAPAAHAAVIGGTLPPAGTFAPVAEILDVRGRMVGQCSGTVVAPKLVLTAGHCAENMRTGALNPVAGYHVITGALSLSAPELQLSSVTALLVYTAFNRRVDAGDAALLVLATPTTVAPVRLTSSATGGLFSSGEPAVLAGWGDTRFAQRTLTEQLRTAPTVVQAPSWCRASAPPFYARMEMCTIDPPTYATGGCSGDSGGPLLASDPSSGEQVQIGILIHGYARCSPRRPTVYTRVDAIASWAGSWIRAYTPVPAPPPAPVPAPPPAPAPGSPPVPAG